MATGGALAVGSQRNRGQLPSVPAIQLSQQCLQGSRACLDLSPTLGCQVGQLGCHLPHHQGRLGRIVPEVGILAVAFARVLRQTIHDRHPVGKPLQGRGQAAAIDQQQAALGQGLALGGGEAKLVGIVFGAQQAVHLDLAGRQPLAEIAKNAVASDHPGPIHPRGGGCLGALAAASQGGQQRQKHRYHRPPV